MPIPTMNGNDNNFFSTKQLFQKPFDLRIEYMPLRTRTNQIISPFIALGITPWMQEHVPEKKLFVGFVKNGMQVPCARTIAYCCGY